MVLKGGVLRRQKIGEIYDGGPVNREYVKIPPRVKGRVGGLVVACAGSSGQNIWSWSGRQEEYVAMPPGVEGGLGSLGVCCASFSGLRGVGNFLCETGGDCEGAAEGVEDDQFGEQD